MSEQPITNVEDAVRELGALPVPIGDVPQPMSPERLAEIREHVAGIRNWSLGNLAARDLLAEVDRLRDERHETNEALSDAAESLRENAARIAELEAQRERRRLRLVALQNDALSMRGSLSPMGGDRKVPFPLGETLTPAVDWLIARVAELEALTPARVQTCRVCGAGYTFGEPCQSCAFRARMAAELQARVRRPGLVGHDLPESGGQR
ncbi:hypothetical protein [Streptomyces sp. FL07-04A]|uniref:hypothetical protein n=1 Tax=Streptomyces sp. FL07-04A TaxID=3028658 RepID=UPI0029A746D9|nr:hypothetical protein [Streptomyces sp. FL07-04A]MDX3575917.1 hypothetical protein [Streptomyces sp. FL07-04A]